MTLVGRQIRGVRWGFNQSNLDRGQLTKPRIISQILKIEYTLFDLMYTIGKTGFIDHPSPVFKTSYADID